MPRGGRWLLTPVIAVLALASLGGIYASITLARDQDTYSAPGTTYDVGDHRLHLDCRGHGGPTVVLFNGLGGVSASWARVTGPVAETGRVCAYDRAGQGWSDDSPDPQDGVAAAKDLHALLAAAGEAGPYVLVGHSTARAARNVTDELSTDHLHRTVDSTHTGLLEDKRPSTESVRAITDVVAAARRLDGGAPHPHRPHDRPATPGLAMIRTNERTAHVHDTFQGR